MKNATLRRATPVSQVKPRRRNKRAKNDDVLPIDIVQPNPANRLVKIAPVPTQKVAPRATPVSPRKTNRPTRAAKKVVVVAPTARNEVADPGDSCAMCLRVWLQQSKAEEEARKQA